MVLVFAGWTVTLLAARKFKEQLYIQIATVVVVFVAGLVLIPPFGVMGAVESLLAGGVVRLILTASAVRGVIQTLAETTDSHDVAQDGSGAR
jgi:O-antigen/teichoic acid export membrane protein